MERWRKERRRRGGSPFSDRKLASTLGAGRGRPLPLTQSASSSSGAVTLRPFHTLLQPLVLLSGLTGGTGSLPLPAGAVNISLRCDAKPSESAVAPLPAGQGRDCSAPDHGHLWGTHPLINFRQMEGGKECMVGEDLLFIGCLASTQTHTFPLCYLFFVTVARQASQFIFSIPSRIRRLEEENPQSCKSQCLCRRLDGFMPLIKDMFPGMRWLKAAQMGQLEDEKVLLVFFLLITAPRAAVKMVFWWHQRSAVTMVEDSCCGSLYCLSPPIVLGPCLAWGQVEACNPIPTRLHAREL